MYFKCIFFVIVLLCSSGANCFAINLYGIPEDQVVIWSSMVNSDHTITDYRADISVNPASTMKILTSYSGLVRLGPEYRWRTLLASAGKITNETLRGDLYWIGSGDAMFDQEDLLSLQDMLSSQKVKAVTGNLILDRSIWFTTGKAENFTHDANRAFMIAPDTHLTSVKGAWLYFYFDQEGPKTMLYPPLKGVNLVQKMVVNPQMVNCTDVRNLVRVRKISDYIEVSGALPVSCNETRVFVNIPAYLANSGQFFIDMWHMHGQTGLNSVAEGKVVKGARILSVHDSAPLSKLLYKVNKLSDNTRARTLYLTLGTNQAPDMDTLGGSEYAVRRTLAEAGISDEVLVLENGAGLSRKERVSARLLGEVLRHAAQGPHANFLMDSLPIAGVDGTLKHRFPQYRGNLLMKTGSLADVRALAGYWRRTDGRLFVLVIIVNSPQAKQYIASIEKIVRDQVAIFQKE